MTETQKTTICPGCGIPADAGPWGLDPCDMRAVETAFAPSVIDREYLQHNALHDAKQAVECMEAGDWLRADVLLKLAVDQISDTGLIP